MLWNLLHEFLSIMTTIHVIGRHFLKERPNISDPTKRHDKQLTFFNINGNMAKSVAVRTEAVLRTH